MELNKIESLLLKLVNGQETTNKILTKILFDLSEQKKTLDKIAGGIN